MSERDLAELHRGRAQVWRDPLLDTIRSGITYGRERLVALDDDPTGSQTVHDVPVLLSWDRALLLEVLASEPVTFVLTNSRSLPGHEAMAIYRSLGERLRSVADELGVSLRVASRSDSTLRGHFPGEVEALAEGLGGGFDGVLLVPAFIEGGRLTVDDVHYAVREGRAIPVGETEFAKDATFGFSASNLARWVEEKSGGRIPADSVLSVTLDDIRLGGPDRVGFLLDQLRDGRVAVINALDYADLEVVAAAAQAVESGGRRLLYRTGASFVRARGGVEPRRRLEPAEPNGSRRGAAGLVVCGSHVPMTTRQVEHALQAEDVAGIEVDVAQVVAGSGARAAAVDAAVAAADEALSAGQTALLYTSREYLAGDGPGDGLDIGRSVSDALVDIVRNVGETPSFVIAKGGITSHVIAQLALELQRATVLGQILPGVSAWRASDGSPPLPYVVFPGNVGGEADLLNAIRLAGRIGT